jgi:hypothetical protein
MVIKKGLNGFYLANANLTIGLGFLEPSISRKVYHQSGRQLAGRKAGHVRKRMRKDLGTNQQRIRRKSKNFHKLV